MFVEHARTRIRGGKNRQSSQAFPEGDRLSLWERRDGRRVGGRSGGREHHSISGPRGCHGMREAEGPQD